MTKLTRDEFIAIHQEVIARHINTHWDWKWFSSHLVTGKRDPTNRFGWWADMAPKYIQNGMNVLDLAGGIGQFGIYLLTIEGLSFSYTVFDLPVMEEIAEDYFKSFNVNASFLVGDLHFPLPLKDEEFDMVWLFGWCQIERLDCRILFKEIHRILKKKGIFMFNMAYSGYAVKFEEEELRKLMQEVCLEIEILDRQSSFAPEFVVLARKKE